MMPRRHAIPLLLAVATTASSGATTIDPVDKAPRAIWVFFADKDFDSDADRAAAIEAVYSPR